MSTVGDAVDRCLSTWLEGTFSTQLNAVATGIVSTVTEITCQLPLIGVGVGAFVAIDDELLYVADTDQTNNRIVVIRGARGTTPAAHVAGANIEVNPRFPRYLVREAMAADIDSWPESLYSVQQFAATLSTLDTTIVVPDSINGFVPRHVLKVRRKSLAPNDDRYRRTAGFEAEWDLLDTATIMLNETTCMDQTFAIQVACAFNSDAVDDDDNDLADDVGLSGGMQEILELGAAYRLLMGRGSVRLFPESEGQSRSAAEVGGTDIPRLATQLLALKEKRSGEEAERLISRTNFGGS